jgi:hypothetical protein
MPFFKIRTKLLETLPYLRQSGSGIALEHVLDAIGRINPSAVTVTKIDNDHVSLRMDIAELITFWKYGVDLKGQDMRTHASICKLLDIKI